MNWQARWSMAIATILVAACAGSTSGNVAKAPENSLLNAAQSMQTRAAAAFRASDWQSADQGFDAAAKIYDALAMNAEAAAARLSAARALSQMGQAGEQQALIRLRQVLVDEAVLPSHLRITALGRLSALLLAQTDLSASRLAWQSADALCRASQSPCDQSAALAVLNARLSLAEGDAAGAQRMAGQALELAANDANEKANALRIRASAALRLNQAAAALQDLAQALEMDRAAGAAERVEADLRLQAQAYQALGQTNEAERALQLAERSKVAQQALQRGLP